MRIIGCLVLVGIVGIACGKQSAPPPPPPPPVSAPSPAPVIDAAPPPADAAALPFAADPSADARALGVALAGSDLDGIDAEVARFAARRPDDPPLDPPRFDVIDALIAWDRSGAFLRVDCGDEGASVAGRLYRVGRAAIALAPRAPAPELHAAARLAQALRSIDNAPAAITVGVALADALTAWARDHHVAAAEVLGDAAVERDVVRRTAHAEARCVLAEIPTMRAELAPGREMRVTLEGARREAHLDVGDDVVDVELGALTAFVHETEAIVDRAGSDAELARALDERIDAGRRDPRSILVQTIGVPYAARALARAPR